MIAKANVVGLSGNVGEGDLTGAGSTRGTLVSFPSGATGAARQTPEALRIEELTRENSELKRTLAELEGFRTLAYRDALTGLWNRRYFEERLAEEISRARRDSSRRFSVMAIDLNELKRINDVHGHAAGDRAIRWVGSFLKSKLREHDVCCRTGGDEFVVLLLDAGATEMGQLIARLRGDLATANKRRELPIGLSFGAASYPDDATSARSLCLRADEAMYRDKRRQKGIEETNPRLAIVEGSSTRSHSRRSTSRGISSTDS